MSKKPINLLTIFIFLSLSHAATTQNVKQEIIGTNIRPAVDHPPHYIWEIAVMILQIMSPKIGTAMGFLL